MSRPPAGCISWSSLFFLWEGRWSPFMQDRIKHTPNQSVKLGSWNHFKRGGAHAQRESLFKDVQLKLKAQVTSIIHFFNRLKLREFFFLIPVFTSRVAVTLPTSRLKPTTIYSLAVTNNLIMRFKLCLDVSEGWRWAALAVIPPPDTVKNLPSYTPPLIAVKRSALGATERPKSRTPGLLRIQRRRTARGAQPWTKSLRFVDLWGCTQARPLEHLDSSFGMFLLDTSSHPVSCQLLLSWSR